MTDPKLRSVVHILHQLLRQERSTARFPSSVLGKVWPLCFAVLCRGSVASAMCLCARFHSASSLRGLQITAHTEALHLYTKLPRLRCTVAFGAVCAMRFVPPCHLLLVDHRFHTRHPTFNATTF